MRYLFLIISILFGVMCLWASSSRWGIGYDPDSILYEDVAENMVAGYGITRFDFATGDRYPMTNFPPVYPAVLGALSTVIGSVAESARILNTALWGVVWLLVYGWTTRDNRSVGVGWMTATLLMVNLLVFQVFGTSWSEPLFLVLSLGGLWLLVSYLDKGRWLYLVGMSVLFAVAILTRYAGVALVLTAVLMLFTADMRWWKRLSSIVLMGILSGAPLVAWLLRNVTLRGDVFNRDVGFTLIGVPQIESAVQTFGSWLIPVPNVLLSLILIGLMYALMVWTGFRLRNMLDLEDDGLFIMHRWVVIYLAFVVVSFSLLDPRIRFDYRILLPAYVGIVISVGRWLALRWGWIGIARQRVWRFLATALVALNVVLSVNWVILIRDNGQQYSDARLQQVGGILSSRESAPEVVRYTNNHFLYHHLTDQPALMLPTATTNDIAIWVADMPDAPIEIVFFHALSQRGWDSARQLERMLPVNTVIESDIVTVYTMERQ